MTRVFAALTLAVVGAATALATPLTVVACTCQGPPAQGDVVFTGVVTDSPNRSILFRDVWEGNRGVYTFDVQSVIHGDPLDGRVWTSYGGGACGRVFELGATYEVNANIVDPGQAYPGGPPEAALATGTCLRAEYLKAADMMVLISALAMTPEGIAIGVVALGLVAGTATYIRRARRPRVR